MVFAKSREHGMYPGEKKMISDKQFIILESVEYRKRVLGCWLGKSIGGTLGQPYEGHEGPLALTFYDPVPQGAIPNDDLDLQVLWVELVRRYGPKINRIHLAKGWLAHTDFPWDEYGVAESNIARGIFPPLSGHHSNYFGDCMGSPIRSEIWALLAPGDPELACKLAYEDAIIDHDGEGIWGELFLAAVESAAFVQRDRDRLLEIGLSAIPATCRIAKAVRSTIAWYQQSPDWRKVRENILAEFGHPNFTDGPQNLAFIVLGWLAGKDFGDSICIAVNCGRDTDCTGASLGALLGILDPAGIPDEWQKPISNQLVLSKQMKNMNPPKTIDILTDWTVELAEEMLKVRSSKVRIGKEKQQSNKIDYVLQPIIPEPANSMLLSPEPLQIVAIYPEGLTFIPGKDIPVTLQFINHSPDSISAELKTNLPFGWSSSESDHIEIKLHPDKKMEMTFNFKIPENIRNYQEHITVQIGTNHLWAEYNLPFVSAWPWEMEINNHKKLVWLPERTLLPLSNTDIQYQAEDTLKAKTNFHFPRRQYVRIGLASNCSASLKLDGRKIIDYKQEIFMASLHRMPENIFHDVLMEPGIHQLEISLRARQTPPKAALVFGDGYNHLLINDISFYVDSMM